MKLRRRSIADKYATEIDALYSAEPWVPHGVDGAAGIGGAGWRSTCSPSIGPSGRPATLRVRACAKVLHEMTAENRERWEGQHHVDRDSWRRAGVAGLLLDIPAEYGGGGGDLTRGDVQHELTRSGTCVGVLRPLHHRRPLHQQLRYRRAEAEMASRGHERRIGSRYRDDRAGTGSTPQSVRTTAVRDGDEYVINGSKTFISNATQCDLLAIAAKTAPALGASGMFIVAETAGLAARNGTGAEQDRAAWSGHARARSSTCGSPSTICSVASKDSASPS